MEMQKDTLEVGKKLVDYCKSNQVLKAVQELYSEDIISQEAMESPEMPSQVKGLEAIKKKNKQWEDSMEVHSSQVDGPFPLGDRFAVHFKYDTTDKKTNKRWQMEEVALYTVKNGKIIKEEFFYTM
ncbi:MAG TPA: nuclear transport factor 2 family protein [Bdellovibrio sp.]|uniref:nuclear transport factor 2 family protein n=1 Tax=Bdellovibrio sp. TaxID=28201 RepID=UPI002EEAFD95